jgi:hypothetical protein
MSANEFIKKTAVQQKLHRRPRKDAAPDGRGPA